MNTRCRAARVAALTVLILVACTSMTDARRRPRSKKFRANKSFDHSSRELNMIQTQAQIVAAQTKGNLIGVSNVSAVIWKP